MKSFYVSKYVLIAFKSVLKLSKGFHTCICKNNRNTLKIASKYTTEVEKQKHTYIIKIHQKENAKTVYKLLENSLRVV